MNKNLVIVGDTAFSEIAFEYFSHDSDYKVCGFSVEKEFRSESIKFGLPCVDFENIEDHFSPETHEVFVATTYTELNRLRKRLSDSAKTKGYKLASYISSKAFVWSNVVIGEHCFIFEDNTIQPFVEVGNNVIFWSGNHIGHHSTIQDNCFISSHVVISGYVDVGPYSFLGVNCTISNNVRIEKNNWIGPDVTIMKDTQKNDFWRPHKNEAYKVNSLEFFGIEE